MYTVRQITGADIHKVGPRYLRNCDLGHGVMVSKDDTEIGYYGFDLALENHSEADSQLVLLNQNFILFEDHRNQGHWKTENAKQIIRAFRDWQFNFLGIDKLICYVPTTKLETDYDEGHWESVTNLEEGEDNGGDSALVYKRCICTSETYKKVYGIEE